MQHFAEIQRRLETRRRDLQERLEIIRDEQRHVDGPVNQDFAEQAVERETEEVVDALGEAGHRELAAVNNALKRIESGEYGTCTECGKPIPDARLEILPFSDRCVSCAE